MARKILLADDSVTAQNMGRKILADAGYEVITVNNGSAALKKIFEIKPDLVILDVYMPGYSGLEVCQRLKETPDSARVPVLLTVGKLEPFKPEEAQRVRAEAFIVKPFEASELLSTLTKLEDKVVPRSEPSKTGRFARAIASVEESVRGRLQPIEGGDESGWKKRISFPSDKAKAEEKVEDESSIYNPVNRDLRTVVATPAERVEEQNGKEKQFKEMAVESGVDVAAVAPKGAPQDVTPEEVAAIAAAAAQIQALQAQLENEKGLDNEAAAANTTEVAGTPESAIEPSPKSVPPAQPEEVAETQDIPMTMAAASGDASRWTAVSVALDADDANISLEQEMQKAYAAMAAQHNATAEEHGKASQAESPAVGTEAAAEHTPAAASQSSQHEPVTEQPPAAMTTAQQGESASPAIAQAVSASVEAPSSVAAPESMAMATGSVPPQPEHETSSLEAIPAETLREPALHQPAEDFSALQPGANAIQPVALEARESAPAAQMETNASALPETAAAAAAASGQAFTSFGSGTAEAHAREQHLEELHRVESVHEEAESVKSSAAAWASWRQIRDTNDLPGDDHRKDEAKPAAPDAAEGSALVVDAPVVDAPAEAAAMAVAAGAERVMQEASQPASENPADVASIVDSVLADLRPRLMAEISRKISEKK